MPFHRAIPPNKTDDKGGSGFKSYVEAEKLMQIAFVLPSAVAVGGALGYGAEQLLHQKWMLVAGIIFGCISGLYYVIQTAFAAEKISRKQDAAQNGTGTGTPGDPS
ncbi:MAG: AtpZ/AtpI family protein [Terracidiphilus sp.]|jgi:F0F1-type ATP synthase assembly protein I